MSPSARSRPSSIALAIGLAALAMAAWLLVRTNRLEHEVRQNQARPSVATTTESMPSTRRETPEPRSYNPAPPSQTQTSAAPFATERAGVVERENKSEAEIRRETTDRFNRLWHTFLSQSSSSFDPARANSMRDNFNAEFASHTFAPDTRIGTLDCRGSMCSAEISCTKLDDAQSVTATARAAGERMRRDTGQAPLVHVMALPPNDDGVLTERVYFEWLPPQ